MRCKPLLRSLVGVFALTLAIVGTATGAEGEARGIDPNQGSSLVEVHLDSKADAIALQLDAEKYGIDFNEHYLRHSSNGGVTVTVFGTEEELQALEAAGYSVGGTIEGPATWRDRAQDWIADVQKEEKAEAAARSESEVSPADTGEIVVLRADLFENYAGRFLSVEAKTRLATVTPSGGIYTGPSLVLAWNRGDGTPFDSDLRTMNVNIDVDTTPDTYIEHRILVRVGDAGTTTPPSPTMIRIGSSTSQVKEAPVQPWLDGGLPPMASTFQTGFHTRYMDPTEVYARFDELAEEFPNLAEMIKLPNKTNGYQRRAQALMAGLVDPSFTGNLQPPQQPAITATQAVILTSRAWGHEGGNDLTAEFVNPGIPSSPLTVSFTNGKDLRVSLGTSGTGALASTAAQVVQAINASPAFEKLVAQTYRGNAGNGIVQGRPHGKLSDFLTEATNAHVKRGPFEYKVMRIRTKAGNNERVGVFLYCQQHAREWATPLTCLETAEQLLRNYGTDKTTRKLLDTLDIFILPSSNPDGAHYSMHNFNMQRRTMTNWCMNGSLATDDPSASNFWTPRANPLGGTFGPFNDSAARDAWGVDMNRNNTFGTLFDGYIGASNNCVSDVFAGPSEASEPEIKNELWIADTFKNIKFSNNIHSFGGYFMWAPGTYKPDRGEGEAVHANIGVEKYFFEAGDRILNRIKDVRKTTILPERTGPIADVLYSAAGNSADEHWYNRGVIAYSFETGADRFGGLETANLSVASAADATAVRSNNRNLFAPLERVTFDPGLPTEETRVVQSVSNPNPTSPAPNITFTQPLQFGHAAGAVMRGQDRAQIAVGFQPDYASEGKHEALEFAAGNYGLLESAYDYAKDETAPEVVMTGARSSSSPITTTFQWVNEPSVIRYTIDGSDPASSTAKLWDATGPREPGQAFVVSQTTTFKWLATDIKGNSSTGQAKFLIKK
jgi:Zinc carboxypeptidase/Chitobiase/beta-hexosaminidase C-terminal domain